MTDTESIFPVHRKLHTRQFDVVGGWFIVLVLQVVSVSAGFDLSYFSIALLLILSAIAIPSGLHLLLLYMNREPVVDVNDTHVLLTNPSLPWRRAKLSKSQILDVDYTPTRSKRCVYLTFHVTDQELEQQQQNQLWETRNGNILNVNVFHTAYGAGKIANCLREKLGLPFDDSIDD